MVRFIPLLGLFIGLVSCKSSSDASADVKEIIGDARGDARGEIKNLTSDPACQVRFSNHFTSRLVTDSNWSPSNNCAACSLRAAGPSPDKNIYELRLYAKACADVAPDEPSMILANDGLGDRPGPGTAARRLEGPSPGTFGVVNLRFQPGRNRVLLEVDALCSQLNAACDLRVTNGTIVSITPKP